MEHEKKHVRIDDSTIRAGDPWAVVQPVWFTANIYEGPVEYERSLQSFSHAQRLVFALEWYIAEVNNGGHDQFYFNSTGIVWRDALEACKAIGANAVADILERSAMRLGGSPSLDREERNRQMEEFSADFEDLDDLFYEIQPSEDLEGRVMRFIQARPSEFYFDGDVSLPVYPSG